MEILRKSLKAYVCALLLFLMLTLILAAVIRFTAFPEEWSYPGLIAALSAASMFLGMIEGRITGRRGLITGIISSVLFIFIIVAATGSAFAESFGPDSFDLLYLIPVLTGTIGAIAGTNSNK
ncbi:MAG: TIGR04086 family membrane protein [Lentihominibacter sp.]